MAAPTVRAVGTVAHANAANITPGLPGSGSPDSGGKTGVGVIGRI